MAEEKEKEKEKKTEEKQEVKSPVKKSTSNLPVIAGIIAGVIIIEAIMLFYFLKMVKPPDQEEVEAKMHADSVHQTAVNQTEIGEISEKPIEAIVNIAGTNGTRFLKVVLVCEFNAEEHKELGEELVRRQAKMKNMLIEQLSALTFDEVNDPDAQVQIRKEFMRRVNNSLPEEVGQISNVYLNEFIVQ